MMLRRPTTHSEEESLAQVIKESTKATSYMEQMYSEAHSKFNETVLLAKTWQVLANSRIKYDDECKLISGAFENTYVATEGVIESVYRNKDSLESLIAFIENHNAIISAGIVGIKKRNSSIKRTLYSLNEVNEIASMLKEDHHSMALNLTCMDSKQKNKLDLLKSKDNAKKQCLKATEKQKDLKELQAKYEQEYLAMPSYTSDMKGVMCPENKDILKFLGITVEHSMEKVLTDLTDRVVQLARIEKFNALESLYDELRANNRMTLAHNVLAAWRQVIAVAKDEQKEIIKITRGRKK
jgi:hypothetical protein